jgi:hypothetical protein
MWHHRYEIPVQISIDAKLITIAYADANYLLDPEDVKSQIRICLFYYPHFIVLEELKAILNNNIIQRF